MRELCIFLVTALVFTTEYFPLVPFNPLRVSYCGVWLCVLHLAWGGGGGGDERVLATILVLLTGQRSRLDVD